MATYTARRMLLLIPILFGVTALIFSLLAYFPPEQRASLYIRDPKEATPEAIAAIIVKYHLDDPIYVQYFHWLSAMVQGNWGYSQVARAPVFVAITQALPATVELVIFAIPITILLGIYLGTKSAIHKDTWADHGTRTLSIIGWSLPTFWLALALVAIFYNGLGLVSTGRLSNTALTFVTSDEFTRYSGMFTIDGILNGQLWITLDALQHLVLPTMTLTVVQVALIVRVMRSSMLEAMDKGYVVAARARGLRNAEVINRHAKKNALIPVVTISGVLAATMINGVVITETVFDYKGMGFFAAHFALELDHAGMAGFSLVAGVVFAVANLLVDLIYGYLNPRIRIA